MNEHIVAPYILGERNPLFDADNALLVALITYAAVILACASIWMAALQTHGKSESILRNREAWVCLGSLAGFALVLAVVTQVVAAKRITLLGDNADKSNPIANFIRSGSPTLSPRSLKFNGIYFVGPRSALVHQWDRLVLQSSAWKPEVPAYNRFGHNIEVGVSTIREARPPDCRALTATRTVCADLKRTNARRSAGARAYIEAFEYDSTVPEAELPDNLGGPATVDSLRANYGKDCRIKLVGVPFEGFKTEAWVVCGDTWPAEARRLKALVTPWFSKGPR